MKVSNSLRDIITFRYHENIRNTFTFLLLYNSVVSKSVINSITIQEDPLYQNLSIDHTQYYSQRNRHWI